MALTNTECDKAKPRAKAYKLFDGAGLYLEVSPKGQRWWRLKYRYGGKENRISLGVYPQVSLKAARAARDEQKALLAKGVDPSRNRQLAATRMLAASADDFETVARDWFATKSPGWAKSNSSKIIERLERDIFPWIGRAPVREVTSAELLAVLKQIVKRGAVDTAHRALQNCKQVFTHAIIIGKADNNPAAALGRALPPAKHGHYASVKDPAEIGELMRKIEACRGFIVTRSALRLAPYVFVRPAELRGAEWGEIDLDRAEWRIEAHRMKMKQPHIVPLSRQAVAILREVQRVTWEGPKVFPGAVPGKAISDGTLRAALMDIGYTGDVQTIHGFRSMASTLLNEHGWPGDWIERQLAHQERNKVRKAYNFAEHLPERRRMMQAWADYLDALMDRKAANLEHSKPARRR